MKKSLLVIIFVVAGATASQAQWRIAGGVNLLTTPFFENVPKYIFGVEGNYFMANAFALTGGLEFVEKDLGASLGFRYYPINPLILRFRGILSAHREAALGMGYAIALNRKWRVETMADYFAVNSDFAIRLGISVSL